MTLYLLPVRRLSTYVMEAKFPAIDCCK